MKGLFIPEITAEMFRNGCLESIEALMAEGEIYDIEYSKWIPVSERLPKEHTCGDGFIDPSEYVLVQMKSGYMKVSRYWGSREKYRDRPWIDLSYPTTDEAIAWMPLPEPYKAESEVSDGNS